MTEQYFTNVNEVIERYNFIKSALLENFIKHNNEVLETYSKQMNIIKDENKKTSFLFNPLKFFNIGETQHSFLLARLLDPYGEHGQGNLFIECFLKFLDIQVGQNDVWNVTAETGRIDVLLKRQHPHTVIVIENKSNFAVDQENQLYRYWYQEIYSPNYTKFQDPKKALEETKENPNYQLVYLTPAEWKKPSEHSLKKPSHIVDSSLPDEIPIKPKIIHFNKEIVAWLNECLLRIENDNYRLREYVKQYIELWTS